MGTWADGVQVCLEFRGVSQRGFGPRQAGWELMPRVGEPAQAEAEGSEKGEGWRSLRKLEG